MAYIGKVKVGDTWSSLATLIQEQIDGQGSFAFESGKTYCLQGEGPIGVRFANSSATPEDNNDGERIFGTQIAVYGPDDATLYTKADQNAPEEQWLKISQIG